MACRLWLTIIVLFIVGMPETARGQDDPAPSGLRYIEELKQRNADYGPGCDGIGISTPLAVAMPVDISTRWAAGHSACTPGLRLVMACDGQVVENDRIIGCTMQVADGESAVTTDCERFTLIARDARFEPDAILSEALAQRTGDSVSQPCSAPGAFSPGVMIAIAFRIPAADSSGDLGLLIDLDGSEVPAFLIPAGQLGVTEPPRP